MSMFIRSLQTNIVLKWLDISMNPCPSSVVTKVLAEVEANNLLVALTHDPMSVNAIDLPGLGNHLTPCRYHYSLIHKPFYAKVIHFYFSRFSYHIAVHDALMRKLKYLSQRTLFAMHRNSSFCLQGFILSLSISHIC